MSPALHTTNLNFCQVSQHGILHDPPSPTPVQANQIVMYEKFLSLPLSVTISRNRCPNFEEYGGFTEDTPKKSWNYTITAISSSNQAPIGYFKVPSGSRLEIDSCNHSTVGGVLCLQRKIEFPWPIGSSVLDMRGLAGRPSPYIRLGRATDNSGNYLLQVRICSINTSKCTFSFFLILIDFCGEGL